MEQITERTVEKLAYYPGMVDYPAINVFLSSLNPAAETDRIAQLATRTAFKAEGASNVDLVQNAIEIQAEAEKAVIRRRESILAKMNLTTVLRLLEMVEGLHSATSEGEEREQGPYRSIRLTVMERLEQAKVPPSVGRTHEEILVALALTDKRGGARPEVPCDLATALRYAIGAKRMHPEVLDKAFNDFLYTFQLQRITSLEAIEERELRRDLDGPDVSRGSQKVGEVVKTASTDWDKEIFTNPRERLSRLEDRRSFLLNFKPGLKPPGSIEKETIELIELVWKKSDSVSVESLVWLSANFYPFWTKHMRSYLKNHKTARLAAAKTKNNKTVGGKKGRDNGVRDTSIEYVKEWLKYADSREKRPSEVIEIFVNQCAPKTPRAKKKKLDFLLILQEHVARNSDVNGVLKRLLQNIKDMTSETIEACAEVLIQHNNLASAALHPASLPAPTSRSSKSISRSTSRPASSSSSAKVPRPRKVRPYARDPDERDN